MYKCGIGKLSGTECGSVTVKDTVINEYQALSDCQRDITGHLEMMKMRGEDVLSEKELILLRTGENTFIFHTSVIEGMFMVDLRANVCNFRESADSREFFNFFIFCPNNLYSTLISKITLKLVTAFYFFMNQTKLKKL